jgi:hypothetical protein
MDKATAFAEMVWQAEGPGSAHAANDMFELKFVKVNVADAKPLLLVTALDGLSEPDPCVIRKLTVTPLCASPWLFTTLAVSGTLTELPEAIHKKGVVTPIAVPAVVAVTIALTDCAGL